jgi:hypothetical protein
MVLSYCAQFNAYAWTSIIQTIWRTIEKHQRGAIGHQWEITHLKIFNIAILSPVWIPFFYFDSISDIKLHKKYLAEPIC